MFFDQFDKLTGAIYDAARRGELWPDVLRQICEMLGCTIGNLWILSRTNAALNVSHSYGWTDATREQYLRKWAKEDPWLQRIDQFPEEEAVFARSTTVVSDEELEATVFYREFLLPLNAHYGGGVRLARREGMEAVLTVLRPKAAGPFTDHEMSLANRLSAHLQRAVQIMEERAWAEQGCPGLRVCFEELPFAVGLLDQTGQVMESNSKFKKLVQKRDGIEVVEGRVVTAQGESIRTERQVRSFPVPRVRKGTAFWLTIRPVPGEKSVFGGSRIAGIVEIRDPDRATAADGKQLEALFGLTPAEIRLAKLMASGYTVTEASEKLGIAEQTGRTHLKRAMHKTGTRRQAEFISRIIALD